MFVIFLPVHKPDAGMGRLTLRLLPLGHSVLLLEPFNRVHFYCLKGRKKFVPQMMAGYKPEQISL